LAVVIEDARNEMTMLLSEAQHLKGTVPHLTKSCHHLLTTLTSLQICLSSTRVQIQIGCYNQCCYCKTKTIQICFH